MKLSETDRFFLVENLSIAPECGPDDPQGKRLYAAESNVLFMTCPVWTAPKIVQEIREFETKQGLVVRLDWSDDIDAFAFPSAEGGSIQLNRDQAWGDFRLLERGQYLAALVMHELAHILTPQVFDRPVPYGHREFQSHGAEFVRCYLDLLRAHMDTRKAEEAFEFMGIAVEEEN